jgi:hypothetical protein
VSPTTRSDSSTSGGRNNLLTSVLLVFPILLFYEVGVLFTDVMNGADFVTSTLLHWLGLRGYLMLQAGLVVVFIGAALYLRRTQAFHFRQVLPVLLESGIYALTMGTVIIFLMVELLGINPQLAAGGSPVAQAGLLERLIMAAGAGVHEEIVFRLVLLSALVVLGEKVLSFRRGAALVMAFVVSSLLFSAAHHVGPLGEPLRLGAFTYRFIAGLIFAALYQFRSFAIAVYTHTLYDVYVMVFI